MEWVKIDCVLGMDLWVHYRDGVAFYALGSTRGKSGTPNLEKLIAHYK